MDSFSRFSRRVFDALASLRLAVVVMVTLGTTCLLATIYESKHGTAAVQRHIYMTGWFAAILVALGINIFCVMVSRYPWKKHHIGFVLAHIGILILLAGSLISLHFGFDGNMAILEGETSARVTLLTKVLDVGFETQAPTRIDFDFEKSPPAAGKPRRFPLDGSSATVVVEEFAPHVRMSEALEEASSGAAALHFLLEAPFATQDGWLVAGDAEREHIDFGPATFVFHRADDAAAAKRLAPAAGQNHLAFVLAADGTVRYELKAARADGHSGALAVGKPIETPWMGMKVTVDRLFPHSHAARKLVPDTPPVKDERRMPALKLHVEEGTVRSESEWVAWSEAVRLRLAGRSVRVAYRAPELLAPFEVSLHSACTRRNRSDTPLQALVILNETISIEAARAFAERILASGGASDVDRITYAFRRCLSRTPTAIERDTLLAIMKRVQQRIADGKIDAWLLATGQNGKPVKPPRNATSTQLAVYTVVARVLLTIDETITKE